MTHATSTIKQNIINTDTDDEVVTKGFLKTYLTEFMTDFMAEFKRDLFEMLDIKFIAIDKRFDNVEQTVSELKAEVEETNIILERSISENAVKHIKLENRVYKLEQKGVAL